MGEDCIMDNILKRMLLNKAYIDNGLIQKFIKNKRDKRKMEAEFQITNEAKTLKNSIRNIVEPDS